MLTQRIDRLVAAAGLGATLMDVKEPGWVYRVDPDRLRMSSVSDCVLGQAMYTRFVFDDGNAGYVDKLHRLGLNHVSQSDYGFSLPPGYAGTFEEWDALAEAWRMEIRYRLAATSRVPVNGQGRMALVV